MRETLPNPAVRQSQSFRRSYSRDLVPAASHASTLSSFLVTTAAVLLVVASAGFGCLFAWQTGSRHDTALGVLSVAMAVGLELSKPFAISSAFAEFRRLRIVTAAMFALVGLLAIAYSLQAELTLISIVRGDLIAARAAEQDATRKAEGRYQRAEVALKALPPTRPASTLQAEIMAIDVTPGIMIDGVPCGGTLNGKVTREWCPKRAALVAELATSERRSALEALMQQAEQDLRVAPRIATSDPGAVALATYAAALGAKADADTMARWLPLIGVLALEVGAAFSVVLVKSVRPRMVAQVAQPEEASDPAARKLALGGNNDGADNARPLKRGLPALLDTVRANGGAVEISQRKLARKLGVSRTSLQRAMRGLARDGQVTLTSSARGTRIALQ
jgi:hypothetical protein